MKRDESADDRLGQFKASLALKHTPRLGALVWKRLLTWYGSPLAAAENVSSWVRDAMATKAMADAFKSGQWKEKAQWELESFRKAEDKKGHKVLLWNDVEYPDRLKEITDPPIFLYYKGRSDLLAGPGIGVVGSRKCSAYGLSAARKISLGLSEAGITVVSGMAWGIDRQAHLAALDGVGSSVAVLGTGLDVVYPTKNRDVYRLLEMQGALLTEHAPGTPPLSKHFPKRNRIISGLSLGVVLVEAPKKSGGRITCTQALDQGREVYAVSGPEGLPTFEGCRELIEQGAMSIAGAGDILLDLAELLKAEIQEAHQNGAQDFLQSFDCALSNDAVEEDAIPVCNEDVCHDIEKEITPNTALNDEENAVFRILQEHDAMHIDALGRELDWDSAAISRVLLMLEMKGVVVKMTGMQYALSTIVTPGNRAPGK